MSDETLNPKAREAPTPKLDRQLLEIAGLKASDVADILGRSKQAIYQGLSSEKRYFVGISELGAIVNAAIASDSSRLDSLYAFIEANYPSHECDLILPDRISLAQLAHAAEGCKRLIFGFNGNIDHVVQKSLFVRAFTWAHKAHLANLCVVSGQTWLQECLAHQYALKGSYSHIVSNEYQNPLSFVLVEGGTKPRRVFYVGRYALAEADEFNADMLSKSIEPLLK